MDYHSTYHIQAADEFAAQAHEFEVSGKAADNEVLPCDRL